MVLILNGNSERVALAWRKTGLLWRKQIYYCCRSNQMPQSDQSTVYTLHTRTYFWVTIWYTYHGVGIKWSDKFDIKYKVYNELTRVCVRTRWASGKPAGLADPALESTDPDPLRRKPGVGSGFRFTGSRPSKMKTRVGSGFRFTGSRPSKKKTRGRIRL